MSGPGGPGPGQAEVVTSRPDAPIREALATSTVGEVSAENPVIRIEPPAVSTQTISTEHPEVRSARLLEEGRAAEHKRWMEKVRFVAAAALVGIVLVVCLGVVVWPDVSAANKEQAWRVIYLAVGAVVEYLAGRSS